MKTEEEQAQESCQSAESPQTESCGCGCMGAAQREQPQQET